MGEGEEKVVLIPGKKAGVILRGEVGREGTAEVGWGEGGSSGGRGIEISVGVSAKLGGRWGRDMERQIAMGKKEKDRNWEGFQC